MSNQIKQNTLNLFLDGIANNITAQDMRIFVDNIWDDKENGIRKISNLSDITGETHVESGDVIICDGTGIDPKEAGIYIANQANPNSSDLRLVTGYVPTIPDNGNDGEILSIQNGILVWTDIKYVFRVLGTKPINEILSITDINSGSTFIAENDDAFAIPPGFIGDGYTFNGTNWKNIGPLRGEKGDIGDQGNQGLNGLDGNGFQIQGWDTLNNIIHKVADQGDIWVSTTAGNDSAGNPVNIHDSLAYNPPNWINIGFFVGPEGTQGIQGLQGLQGIPGNDGTDGADGAPGVNGINGTDGAQGIPGNDGI